VSLMTFNTIIDACARSNEMCRLPQILKHMNERSIEPDSITYSTILKGLCHEKRLTQALELRETMRGKHALDAHAYAALIDGCSRLHKHQQGFDLIQEMETDSTVVPNNVTLTAIVRLAAHSHHKWCFEKAFSLCEELSRKHCFKLNHHVYSNLLKACSAHDEIQKGYEVIASMLEDGVKLDENTVGPFLLDCTKKQWHVRSAVGLMRGMVGLRIDEAMMHPGLAHLDPRSFKAPKGLSAAVVSDIIEALAKTNHEEGTNLAFEISRETNIQVDPTLKMKLLSQ